jgi:hypothetical protein
MKKFIISIVMVFAIINGKSQNVGIGTITPAEKLDVNGNVNIQGNLKMNGVAGQSGQVLMTNSSGATVWGSTSEFKNIIFFSTNSNWIVPAGVTKILVEVWGAGGGGAFGGGGASGMYTRSIINVNPNDGVSVLVGLGGQGAQTTGGTAADGDASAVVVTPNSYVALGGGGATSVRPGRAGLLSAAVIPNLLHIPGDHGEPTTETYAQINATEYARITKFGDGANSTLLNLGGGKGAFLNFNATTAQNIKLIQGNQGVLYGAGGGGGYGFNNVPPGGSKGADGVVIIWY